MAGLLRVGTSVDGRSAGSSRRRPACWRGLVRSASLRRVYAGATPPVSRVRGEKPRAAKGETVATYPGYHVRARAFPRDSCRWGRVPVVSTPAKMVLMSPSVSAAVSEADSAALLTVAQRLVATARLDEFGEQLVRFALSQAPAERGLFLLPQASGWRLHTFADAGGTVRSPDPALEGGQLPRSLVERTIAAGRPQAVRDPASDPAHAADPYFLRARPAAALCVPLGDRGGLTGLLYLESGAARPDFSEAGIERLGLLGRLIAGSLRGVQPLPATPDAPQSAAEGDRRLLAEAQALAHIGSWEWDAERDALSGSAEFYRLFEVEPEQMADYPAFIARLHPGDRVRVGVEVEAVLDGRQSRYDTEYRVVLADGTIRHLHARGQAQVDASGRCRGLFGTCQDISDRRRADDAIRAAQEQLEQRVQERTVDLHRNMAYTRSLIEAIGDPLLIIDVDGLITDLNQAAERMTGQVRGDLIGADFVALFTDPALARDVQRRALKRGAARGYELELRHVGGHVTPVLFDATVYRDRGGQVAGICGAARDIAEFRRTREELVKNQQLLDEAGRLALIGGWEFDPATRTLSWTRVVHQIHEVAPYSRPTLEDAVRFVAPEAAPALSAAIDAALQQGAPFDLELPLITARDRRIWVRWVGRAYWHEGRVARVGGLIRDVTERRQADEELRHHRDHLEELVTERTAALATTVAELERS
ncbi:MAG: PAS domain S-box protein, partial [Gammaproteobacteria bacterium]|nr:PAS domain S-box protein [Gammaproteobacteria bacterium]